MIRLTCTVVPILSLVTRYRNANEIGDDMMQRTSGAMARINRFKAATLALVGFSVLVSGCATMVDIIEPVDETTVLAANQGYVVARVINTTRYPAPLNQLTITPENLNTTDDTKYQRLMASTPRFNGTSVFASPVDAGTYSLTSLRAYHSNGQMYYMHSVPSDTDGGTFEVRPGQVTDLGQLIYYHRSEGDRYFKEVIRVPGESGDVVDKYFPFLNAGRSNVRGWNEDGLEDERNTLFVYAAQNPTTFEHRYVAPDGTVYFLGKLGVILKRTTGGDWELDAVDTNMDLTTMAENGRGDKVIGGSEGRVFFKRAGSDWEDVSIGYQYDIDRVAFNDDDTIELIARETQVVRVYQGVTSTPELAWREVNHFNNTARWTNSPPPAENQVASRRKPKRIARVELQEVDGQHYVSIYMISAKGNPLFENGNPVHYKYSPDTWQPVEVPKKEMPKIVTSVPAGMSQVGIEMPGFWSWSSLPKYSRHVDSTDSWEEMNTFVLRCGDEITVNETCGADEKSGKIVDAKKDRFTFLSVPWFASDHEAVAVAKFSDRDWWTGQEETEVLIITTNDGGLTWTDSGRKLPQDFCTSFVPEISDRILLSCSVSGDFFETTDLGETWTHVRQHESF